jgi:hypothetical protein
MATTVAAGNRVGVRPSTGGLGGWDGRTRIQPFAADLRDRDLELTSGFNLELFDCILLVGRNDCSEALYFLAEEIDRPRLALVGRYRAAPLTYFLLGTSHSGHRLLHE